MLTGTKSHQRMLRMKMDGSVDMNRIHFRIRQKLFVGGVPFVHAKGVPHLIQTLFIALTNRIHIDIGMFLIDRDKLRTKSKADYRHVYFFICHSKKSYIVCIKILSYSMQVDY